MDDGVDEICISSNNVFKPFSIVLALIHFILPVQLRLIADVINFTIITKTYWKFDETIKEKKRKLQTIEIRSKHQHYYCDLLIYNIFMIFVYQRH